MGLRMWIGGRGGGGNSGGGGSLFWIKNLDDEAVTVSLVKSDASAPTVTLEKSTGRQWSTWGSTSTTALTHDIPVGGVLILRGDNAAFGSSASLYNQFSFTGDVSVNGNMAALIGEEEVTSWEYCFANLFSGCTTIKKVDIDVEEYSRGMFYGCTGLTKIAMQKGCTAIHVSAFGGCTSLTKVKIPVGVTTIGNAAFASCTSLATAVIPSGVTSIGQQAFEYCALTAPSVPDTVTSISQLAFRGCASMTSVTLGSGVTTIGQNAFSGCSQLAAVRYGGTVAQWCGITFANANSNPLTLGHDLYIGGSKVTTLTIPSTVTALKNYAFYGGSFEAVTMADTVTTMGQSVFQSCTGLQAATLSASLTEIPQNGFSGCVSLTSAIIPNGVTTIGAGAFTECHLRTLELPSSVTTIGESAFEDNPISSVSVPRGVTVIAERVFYRCQLETAEIGDAVEEVGNAAFAGNEALTRFTSYTVEAPKLGENVFADDRDIIIFVPPEGIDIYMEEWREYAERIQPIE